MAIGCSTTTIGNTEIDDTPENRGLWERVMEYRRAMEERDTEALTAMVSRKYFDNAGTTDRADDDYGYDRVVNELIPELRDNIRDIQLRVLMRRIDVDGDRAFADYEYFYQFKYVEGGIEAWQPGNDFNRLEFVRENDTWMIASGM